MFIYFFISKRSLVRDRNQVEDLVDSIYSASIAKRDQDTYMRYFFYIYKWKLYTYYDEQSAGLCASAYESADG